MWWKVEGCSKQHESRRLGAGGYAAGCCLQQLTSSLAASGLARYTRQPDPDFLLVFDTTMHGSQDMSTGFTSHESTKGISWNNSSNLLVKVKLGRLLRTLDLAAVCILEV